MQTVRAKNFSILEKHDLLDIIFMYHHIVENKLTDYTTNSKKDEAWTNITNEYNKNRVIMRTEKNLRNCWDNIKRDTKKYCAALKRETYKTGGGKICIEKNPLFERAKEMMGETAIYGLNNPFDCDSMEKENVVPVLNILEENENVNNDPAQVFTYLVEDKQIEDWKSWDKKKLKSQLSPPLNIPTSSRTTQSTKRKFNTTFEEAKSKLADTLKNNVEEKQIYEIEILKATLEMKKLKIDLLKTKIENEKLIKDTLEKQTNITFKL